KIRCKYGECHRTHTNMSQRGDTVNTRTHWTSQLSEFRTETGGRRRSCGESSGVPRLPKNAARYVCVPSNCYGSGPLSRAVPMADSGPRPNREGGGAGGRLRAANRTSI